MQTRFGPLALALAMAGIVSALGAAPSLAQQEAGDDEDLLGGFDDEAEEAFNQDDLLGGFDDDDTIGAATADPARRRSWIDDYIDLSGSVSLGASYNLRPHCASAGPTRDPIRACGEIPAPGKTFAGTYYGNLQRLRLRGDIQADFALPASWKARIQAFGWYDFAYLIHGREHYSTLVLNDYEFRSEILDLYLEGSVTSWLDLKLGRQVVNWGRSDTLRVNDVLNALNNLEPGLADIEDLRLPATMAKIDAYWWKFSFSAIVIPEIRFDWDPPAGSDFFPQLTFSGLPLPPDVPTVEPFPLEVDQWGSEPEYAGSITAIFSGWDMSFYAARVYQNRTTPVVNLPTFSTIPILTDDDRVTMIGLGANYTRGSWLLKGEIAFFDELDYTYLVPNGGLPSTQEARLSRLDWMLGVEYYGWTDVTIALEVAHRHFFDYEPLLQFIPNLVYRNNVEMALRVRYELLNARLRLNALALVLANSKGFLGATIRLDAEYELMDALTLNGGLLYFVGDEQLPFNSWAVNDRLFAKIKYSF